MHEITVTAEWLSSTLPLAYDTAKFLSGVTGGADYWWGLEKAKYKKAWGSCTRRSNQLPIVMYFTHFCVCHTWSRDIGSSYWRVARSIWMGYKTHSFIVRKIRNHKTNLNLFALQIKIYFEKEKYIFLSSK